MLVREVFGKRPRFGARVFVASNAVIVGDVTLGDDASVWYNVVLRGDIHWIRVGARANLQDGVLVHVENQLCPTLIEDEVSVGHGAVLHGCTLRRGCLVGIGAVILNDAEIGEGALVAAGAVVREGFSVPPRTLAAGVPATVRRDLTDEEHVRVAKVTSNYLLYKSRFLADGVDRVIGGPDDLEEGP
jgi:carbonic anhydrase/acetyltransferase-like protein (isoleucine patch superfamily)